MEQLNPSSQALPDTELERLREAIADLQTRVTRLEQGVTFAPPRTLVNNREKPESRLGLATLNRIGAVTLIVGIIFFFKYAADNHWIGAVGLVGLGLLAGIALIGAGEWLRRKNQQTFGQGLAGCGLAVLYIAAYAAFAYSKLVGRGPDFFALLAASALAIALCLRFASPAIAAIGFIGLFSAPLLIRSPEDNIQLWLYFVYLLLLSLASVTVVTRLYHVIEQNTALILLPFNAFWAILCAWILISHRNAGGFVLLTFALAAIHMGATFVTRETARLYGVLYCCAHACFLTAAIRAIEIWTPNRASLRSELDSVFMAVYAVAMIASAVIRRFTLDRLIGLTLIGIVVAKLYVYDVWLLTRVYRISALVLLGVLLLVASYIYSRFKSRGETNPQ